MKRLEKILLAILLLLVLAGIVLSRLGYWHPSDGIYRKAPMQRVINEVLTAKFQELMDTGAPRAIFLFVNDVLRAGGRIGNESPGPDKCFSDNTAFYMEAIPTQKVLKRQVIAEDKSKVSYFYERDLPLVREESPAFQNMKEGTPYWKQDNVFCPPASSKIRQMPIKG